MPSLFTLVVLAAGAALRLWFIHVHPQVQGDSLLYGDIAANWLTHGIYGHSVGHASGLTTIEPTLVRLPGYPAFLALCFAALRRGQLSRRGVPAGAHRPGHLPAHRRPGGEDLRATRRPHRTAAGSPLSLHRKLRRLPAHRNPLDLLRRAGLSRTGGSARRPAAASGQLLLIFSWSFAALLRPDGALLAVVLWTALIVYGRNSLGFGSALRLALLAGLLSLLPFAAWTVRNWHTFHVFQPLAPRYANDPGEFAAPGFVRWVRTLAADFTTTSEIYWNGNSDRIDLANLPARAMDNPAQHQETRPPPAGLQRHHHPDPRNRRPLRPACPGAHPAHPFRYYLSLPLLRLADMWLRPRVETMNVHLRWWQYAQHPAETARRYLLRRPQPCVSGGGFPGRSPLAADGRCDGRVDCPAQPVAGHPRGARIALYPGMFSFGCSAGCLVTSPPGWCRAPA